jgi:activator of 2-hydroxyglutaryl-CoA dehydratase
VQLEPEYTLVGGILRFESMGRSLVERLGAAVNVPDGDLAQFVSALGAAWLGRQRLARDRAARSSPDRPFPLSPLR